MRSVSSRIHAGFFCLLMMFPSAVTQAIETVSGGSTTYQTSDTITSSLASWSTGWGAGPDGWNYVGKVSDASGVYLGNNWVLTAAHVNNPVSFTLNGNIYNATGVSYTNFTNGLTGGATADLHLFQIYGTSTTGTNISLPPLSLSTTLPATSGPSAKVVMIGYGGASGQGAESWGINTVYVRTQYPVTVDSYQSIDFATINSGTSYSSVVLGDSGGGDFMKVGSTWQLAGINEAVISYSGTNPLTGTNYTGSAFVQIGEYSAQLSAIVNSVPEPSAAGLAVLGVISVGLISLRNFVRKAGVR
jgi:hypothetical protein